MSPTEYKPRGRYFEEFEVGDQMVSPGRTVTEADFVMYCGISGDYNELPSWVWRGSSKALSSLEIRSMSGPVWRGRRQSRGLVVVCSSSTSPS
jgi:hypothetical protein